MARPSRVIGSLLSLGAAASIAFGGLYLGARLIPLGMIGLVGGIGAAIGGLAAGVVLVFVALALAFPVKSGSRRSRCIRCGYLMLGLSRRGHCPECGFSYDLDDREDAVGPEHR